MNRRSLIVAAFALGTLGIDGAPVRAAGVAAFDAKAFAAAQAAGQGIVVFVHAPW